MANIDIILEEYSNSFDLHRRHTNIVEDEVRRAVEIENIFIHDIASRTKEPDKLKEKLARKGKNYKTLKDISDLSGVRIVCYFEKDVKKIAKVITDNFEVIHEHTVDKYKLLNPDKFGYISLHYIISLPENHENNNEYSGLQCEVQIRSILQDAWAEIEHSLGYKASISVPKSIKRRFYRLAGLLELADDEFGRIRKDLKVYEKRVIQRLKESELSGYDLDIPIDAVSLRAYILQSDLIKKMDDKISHILGARLIEGFDENDIRILEFFNIDTIDQLNNLIVQNENLIMNFIKEWSSKFAFDNVKKGITIFYLGYVLAMKTFDKLAVKNYVALAPVMEKNKKDVEDLLWKFTVNYLEHGRFN